MTRELRATSFIGSSRGEKTGKTFTAFSPATGEAVGPEFHSASRDELARACELASTASADLEKKTGREKAQFLRTIAANLGARKADLVERASLETGLPNARFEGETARTCGQLRMFADLVEEGSWVDARIDTAMPDRQPLPRPDIRSMRRALGPVAVFCASNFPIAFSVAGGDTTSALAAGCPVIVNAHSAHPGTSEIAAEAISEAVAECGFPEGTFSLLFSSDYEIGSALVDHPEVKAVGFTGSRSGGRALMKIASEREEPIPVFAEMSSVNPTFVLPHAAGERADEIAEGLFASFTLGVGQFCTKPGIIVLAESAGADRIVEVLREKASAAATVPLLTKGIRDAYLRSVSARGAQAPAQDQSFGVMAQVFEVNAEEFLSDPNLQEEVFGPAALIVRTKTVEEVMDIAANIEGQLTSSIHYSAGDLDDFPKLVPVLSRKVGRLVFDGYPTGVEVSSAMVHGGPFPATSNAGTTSVGTRAIERFTRLACYQNAPQEILPDELKDGNPLGISRMVDGNVGRD